MDGKCEDFRGFSKNSVEVSSGLSVKHLRLLQLFEWCPDKIPGQDLRMDVSVARCFEDATNSSIISLKGIVTDNDSGYISQNVESNSSIETASDNRHAIMTTSNVKNVYVNEDTLLEKPQIFAKQNQEEQPEEEYEEFGHLFFMSEVPDTPVLNSSVASQKSTFSGFDGDESAVSNVSGTIPVATPITISSHVLNAESSCSNNTNLSKSSFEQNMCQAEGNSEFVGDLKENDQNQVNIANAAPNNDDNASETETSRNCIETRMMDANNCNMSLFESFYSFVCNLYTRTDVPIDDLANISINPNNLQITSQNKLQETVPANSPYKNSYLQLETIKPENSVCSINNATKPEIEQEATSKNYVATPTDAGAAPLKQPISPDLFSDDEPEPPQALSNSMVQIQKRCEQMYVIKNDRKLVKRARESLGGVPPPPSFTIMHISAAEMLEKISENSHLFATNLDKSSVNTVNSVNNVQKQCVDTDSICDKRNEFRQKIKEAGEKTDSLLVTCKKEDIDSRPWPDILQYRYHGLYYNRSKVSEEFEHLCVKYAQRYVGAETQSSCTVFGTDVGSPSKRKYKLKRVTKSPGKRLSHLARRRITFSKESLQSGSGLSNCSFIGARTRQIMIDARLLSKRKSPRKRSPRKTPGKSPRRKSQTPGSSSKKRLAMRLSQFSAEDSLDSVSSASSRTSVTKRALFQSPPRRSESSSSLLKLIGSNTSDSDLSESSKRRTPRRALFTSPFKASPSKMSISSLYPPKRKQTPKRTLFKSPGKASPSSHSSYMETCDKKRKRIDNDDIIPNKIARSVSTDVKGPSNELKSKSASRSHSSTTSGSLQSKDIVEHRKKKLMWAVAQALSSQNIDLKHPQFKVFASMLARVIRYFLPNLFTNGPRPEGSTTESMLRIARQHVFAVTRGKTADQIIREVQSKSKISKPSGYVGLDKVDRLKEVAHTKNKENVFQDRVNTIGSNHAVSATNHTNKNNRGENVERIRRVINFGDDDENDTGVR